MADEQTPSQTHGPEPVDRRDFLSTTWKVLGVALVVEAGWTSYDILNPKPTVGFGGRSTPARWRTSWRKAR